MYKIIDGGSETARLSVMEDEMPRGNHVPPDMRRKIYNRHTLGESTADIAESTGLAVVTVRRIIREERKVVEKEMAMSASAKIVKKDGKGGKLMALNPDGFEFTHVTPDGKSHKKKVPGHVSRVAERQYDQWCEELDSEVEFMRMVERKPKDEPFVPTDEPMAFEDFLEDEPKVVCGYPGDPIEEIRPIEPAPVPDIEVRPWREVAEERQQRIEELEAEVEKLKAELEEAKTQRIEFAEGFQIELHNPSYLIWANGGEARTYGLYLDEDQALAEVDRLNEVAAFLGKEGAFEVEEVGWK